MSVEYNERTAKLKTKWHESAALAKSCVINLPDYKFQRMRMTLICRDVRESPIRYEQISVRTPTSAICVFGASFGAQIIRATTLHVERELGRATDGLIDTALKIPKFIRLKRYLTPIPIAIGMGIISALLTNLLLSL